MRRFRSVSFSRWHRQLDRPTGAPNPFEGYLLAVCLLQGLSVTLGITRPTSLYIALPHVLLVVWAVLLFLGGLLAVTGLYWPGDPVDGVLIKRIGLIAAGGGTLAYGVALLSLWPTGLVAALMNLGFSAACFHRVWQVSRALEAYRCDLRAIRDATVPIPPVCLEGEEPGDGD